MIPLGLTGSERRLAVQLMKGGEWPDVAGRSWNHRLTSSFSSHLSNVTTTVSPEERQIVSHCETHFPKCTCF